MKTIRLELARSKEFPDGSAAHGYVIHAPLKRDGHLDVEAWRKEQDRCTVRRFWGGTEEERGLLIHTAGRRWAFSYVAGDDADDEPIFRLDSHVFRVGEYLSITEHDGIERTFRVADVS
uniref:Uncharacterized protein n=1 Tax=uncultured bacterium 1114 TaxID=548901 RepID=B8R961_9BACT|nr:hypothetical protein [uncultured bacterium 1114]